MVLMNERACDKITPYVYTRPRPYAPDPALQHGTAAHHGQEDLQNRIEGRRIKDVLDPWSKECIVWVCASVHSVNLVHLIHSALLRLSYLYIIRSFTVLYSIGYSGHPTSSDPHNIMKTRPTIP